MTIRLSFEELACFAKVYQVIKKAIDERGEIPDSITITLEDIPEKEQIKVSILSEW